MLIFIWNKFFITNRIKERNVSVRVKIYEVRIKIYKYIFPQENV